MAFNFPYDQQYGYMQRLVASGKSHGIAKEAVTALAVNAYHESYLNPYTLEGAINPGPPLGANGTGPGGGLWQWTPWEGKIELGDFDSQVQFMIDDKGQWNPSGAWFANAGLADPTPQLDSLDHFLNNQFNYSDTQLTQAFIGYWERPDYTAGARRYNAATEEAPAMRELVDQYWGSDPDENPNNGSPGQGDEDSGNNQQPANDNIKEILSNLVKQIQSAVKTEVPKNVNTQYWQNNKLKVTDVFNRNLHIDFTKELADAIQQAIDATMVDTVKPPEPNGDNSQPGPSDSSNNEDIYNGILNYCKSNLGASFNYEAAHPGAGGQCVDLIKAINDNYLPNHPLTQALSYGNAQDIYHNDLTGTGWHQVEGDINSDSHAAEIWNTLPDGAIVYFQYSTYGHVAVKAGEAFNVYQENGHIPHVVTGIDNLVYYLSSGAGFLGAWVMD